MFISGNHNTFNFEDCRFDSNFSFNPDGIALYNNSVSDSFYFKNVNMFNHNTIINGELLYFISEGSGNALLLNFDSCAIFNNKLGGSSKGLIALLVYDETYNIKINNCLFENNKIAQGSLIVDVTNSKGEISIKNTKFYNNKSQNPNLACIDYIGRGENGTDNVFYLDNCVFARNDGAFTMINEFGSSIAYITNCTFSIMENILL
ncbi:MAG: hypothetical protein IPL95_13290 [Saprospiraceae bacterium]|nr:hypothetical protein [Saprospiraceae bacterium]